jgi:FKBP-type peptidyl-prolyl cis-trans isomerase
LREAAGFSHPLLMRFSHRLLLCFVLAAPLAAFAQREKLSPEDLEIVERLYPNAHRSPTGLRTIVEKEGTGDPVQAGDLVQLQYIGRFLDGKVFEDARAPKNKFPIRAGRGLVIDGWDEALLSMRLGEKIVIVVPYELGYGTRGDPPRIRGAKTLVFEIELVGLERAKPL